MNLYGHMVCHTHWDREWYLTKETFRVKLVKLIDQLLNIIDEDSSYVSFMLDGQTIAIEDYLEIKPENKERLMRALKSGKILCGPWYILPDELLISGESHINNFLTGRRMMKEFGKPMNIAYLPDSFGHPEQLPQLIKGMGMDTAVFWRGTSNEQTNTEFNWQAPDGKSSILCVHLLCGYGNSANLDQDVNKTKKRLDEMFELLGATATTEFVLLMNGSDHITGQSDIAHLIEEYNQLSDTHKIEFSTIENFLSQVKQHLPELETYHGEFRFGERSMVLGGTLSTRMELKVHNHLVQKNMERYLDPLTAIEKYLSTPYDSIDYAHYVWKKILENHPHDSICGCSIDAVHSEMMTRYFSLEDLQNTLITNSYKRIEEWGEQIDFKERVPDAQIMLFEPTQDSTTSYMEVDIDLDSVLVQEVNFARSIIEDYEAQIVHPDLPVGVKIYNQAGQEIPTIFISAKKEYFKKYQDHTMPEQYKVNRVRVGMMLPPMEFGVQILNVYRAEEALEESKTISLPTIENQFYHIAYEDCGFTVTHKATGRVHHNVGQLIDMGDAGDEYTYSWPKNDETFVFKADRVKVSGNRFCRTLEASGNFGLPVALSDDRQHRLKEVVECPVTIRVTLTDFVDRIDFKTEMDNKAEDHRIQAQFPAGVLSDNTRSFNTFSIAERALVAPVPAEWAEYPQNTHPTHGFINISEQGQGISAYTKGLTEYEGVNKDNQSYLNITLLRCVGWLSRTDLLSRHGNGGWSIPTPDAQCLGKHSFEYSVAYHQGDYLSGYGALEKYVHPTASYQLREIHKVCALPSNPFSGLSALPSTVRLSTLKIAQDGSGIILRLFSLDNKSQQVTLPVPEKTRRGQITNLIEEMQEELPVSHGAIQFTIDPAQIITLKLEV